MKKFAAIALALIFAMSSMFATVAVAGVSGETNSNGLAFAGFVVNENSNVVIDIEDPENMKIYGLEPLLTRAELEKNHLTAGKNFTMEAPDYIGTGSKIVLKDKAGTPYTFTVVIFGDLTGDSAIDVIDAAQSQRFHTGKVTPTELELLAGDADKDGEISVDDYASQVNAAVGNDDVDQNATGTKTESTLDVDAPVYTTDDVDSYINEAPITEEDVTLEFNDIVVDSRYYAVTGYDYKEVNGEFIGIATIEGKGLFSGITTVEFKVVSLLEKIVATVNGVIEDAKLDGVVKVEKAGETVNVKIDAGAVISGDFAADVSALNGLLAKIDDFRAKNLKEVDLVVENYAIANNGAFNRSEIKAFGIDLISGIFTAIANAENNVIKSYSGTLVTNDVVPAEDFTVNFVMDGTGREIDKVKDFAAKIANFVSYDVVDGNSIVNITMPAGFATTVVDAIGDGDVEKAIAEFNRLSVREALLAVSAVDAEMLSPTYANAINKVIKVAASLDGVADKVLKEVTNATVTDYVGNTKPLLSGNDFYIDGASFVDIVNAVDRVLNNDAGSMLIGNFANGDVYTAEFDVAIEYKGISEKVIVNFDFFGNAKAPNVIDKTAAHFNGIIADLGIANVANVAYSADTKNAVVSLDASAFINNEFAFNEDALNGLYTNIKGYFDDNYGTSTILVGDFEIVKNGKINRTTLKNFLFDVAKGFFLDVADLGADNVVRNFSVKVTEADGSSVDFDMDFVLEGTPAHIAKIKNIAAKVAECISFTTVNGNAVVNLTLPAGFQNTVVEALSKDGTVESAIAEFNKLTVGEAFNALTFIDAETISTSHASDIERIILTVAEYSNVINKLLGKVTSAKAYDLKGNAYELLNGSDFDGSKIVAGSNVFAEAVKAIYAMLDEETTGAYVSAFTTGDGVYTVEFDVAVSIGGISEKVIVNFDMFGLK